MSRISRFVASVFVTACFALPLVALPAVSFAQNAPAAQPAAPAPAAQPPAAPAPSAVSSEIKQIALTEKQVTEMPATQKELDAVTDKLPELNPEKPDPKVLAQLEAVAKKHGYASYAEYNDVIDNISIVLDGIDSQTKKYIGPDEILKQQIAAVQADKDMPAKDKQEVLDELSQSLKTPAPPIQNKGNIDLVVKHYDKVVAALQDDEE